MFDDQFRVSKLFRKDVNGLQLRFMVCYAMLCYVILYNITHDVNYEIVYNLIYVIMNYPPDFCCPMAVVSSSYLDNSLKTNQYLKSFVLSKNI